MSYLSTDTFTGTLELGITLYPNGPWLTPTHFPSPDFDLTLYPKSLDTTLRQTYNGSGRIYGTLTATVAHLPVGKRKLRLFSVDRGWLVKEGYCDVQGNFEFPYILEDVYYSVVAYDHTNAYDDIIYSPVLPELMVQ